MPGFRRRLINNCSSNNSIACEYIESDGTQYINTGFVHSSENVEFAIDFEYTDTHNNSSIFGTESSSSPKYGLIPWGKPSFYVGTTADVLAQTTSINTRYYMMAKTINSKLYVNLNGVTNNTAYSGQLQKTYPVFLFAENKNGNALYFTKAKVYSFQIRENGILVRDFKPYFKGGKYGMIDILTGEFYSSDSGTEFTGKIAEGGVVPAWLPDYAAYSEGGVLTTCVYIEDTDGYLHAPEAWLPTNRVPNGIAHLAPTGANNARFVRSLQDFGNYVWSPKTSIISELGAIKDSYTAYLDVDGQKNTDIILNKYASDPQTLAPAAYLASQYIFPNGQHGYLGAAGECYIHMLNHKKDEEARIACGGTQITSVLSSTQYGSDDVWYCRYFNYTNESLTCPKTWSFRICPYTKLKSDVLWGR